jgi:hypothetical protein
MAGLTALNKMLRQRAAFGGIMGRDGRRQYGGGSDMGQVADSKGNVGPGTGGYQGGPKGGYGDAGSKDKPSPETRKKEKDKYEKQFGGVSPTGSRPRTFLDTINTYNKNYKTKFVNRQIAKKKQAIRDYISKNRVQNPHMDVDEIMEGIMGSYDPTTQTFGTYDFTSGLNKGTTFDISNIGGPQLGPFGLSTNKKFGDKGKLNTKYLDTTPDFTSHPSNVPSLAGAFLSKGYPININTLKSGLNRINLLETMKASGVTQAKINDYYDRAQGKGKYDIFGGGGGGDGPRPYLPIDYNTGAGTTEDVVEDKTFDYRFGTGQKVGADVLRGYVANGGRITRAGGGIMNAVPRQGFFLGKIAKGIGKAVGSVADAAGKVLKSDLGKAALAAGAFYYGGGGGSPFTAAGRAKFSAPSKNFISKSNPLLFLLQSRRT